MGCYAFVPSVWGTSNLSLNTIRSGIIWQHEEPNTGIGEESGGRRRGDGVGGKGESKKEGWKGIEENQKKEGRMKEDRRKSKTRKEGWKLG